MPTRADAKPGFSFKDWGIRAIQNTAPGWPPTAIDPSRPFKSQTRRVMKKQPVGIRNDWDQSTEVGDRYVDLSGNVWRAEEPRGRNKRAAGELTKRRMHAPYRLGQLYYAKEALYRGGAVGRSGIAVYEADEAVVLLPHARHLYWRSSDLRLKGWYMPRAAARLFYVLRGIRAEQVQDIGRIWDTLAEGVDPEHRRGQGASWQQWRGRFARYFDEINGDGTWEKNPWVWVYEMERVEL